MEIFRRKPEKTKKNKSIEEEPEYLRRLKDQIGKEVTVKYIAGSKHLIETGILKKVVSSGKSFYLGSKDGLDFHLIDIDRINDRGERYAVYSIKDDKENVIYENQDVPFVEKQAENVEKPKENN